MQDPQRIERRPEIVLIGPLGVGKSTVGQRLAARLGVPRVSADAFEHNRYHEFGLVPARAQEAQRADGLRGFYHCMGPVHAAVLERLFAEHRGCVFDLGAAHTHSEDPTVFRRVQRALATFAHVVLLLPSPDPDRSVRILRRRRRITNRPEWRCGDYDVLEHWVKDPSHRDLATMTVFTERQTPDQTCDEILRLASR